MRALLLASAVVAAGGVAACTASQLTAAGVPVARAAVIATITQDVAASGQLFCTAAGVLYQAGAVNVVDATAATVAAACKVLRVGSQLVAAVPVPVAPGQTAIVAEVSPAAAAAVAASVLPK